MSSIDSIVTRLRESKVGAFFIVNGDILSNSVNVRDGDEYGNYVNYSSHWDLWRAAQKEYPLLKRIEYDTFPRGRVVYNKATHKYIIYLDPKLNNEIDIEIITMEYRLKDGSYEVNDSDEHYQSDPHPPEDVYLDERLIFEGDLSRYVKKETY